VLRQDTNVSDDFAASLSSAVVTAVNSSHLASGNFVTSRMAINFSRRLINGVRYLVPASTFSFLSAISSSHLFATQKQVPYRLRFCGRKALSNMTTKSSSTLGINWFSTNVQTKHTKSELQIFQEELTYRKDLSRSLLHFNRN
jgi:hypothetical protein